MSTDMAKAIEPKSDQQNYDDYVAGPKVVTISETKVFDRADQPVEVHLVEFPGRPYKPSKSMRRVLVAGWGGESSTYAGRSLRLYGDPTVKFGGQEVGGIKISHMSHLPGALRLNLTVTRGKREPYVVEPLTAPLPDGWEDDVAACDTLAEITEFYEMALAAGWWSPVVAAACTARKQELEVSDGGRPEASEAHED